MEALTDLLLPFGHAGFPHRPADRVAGEEVALGQDQEDRQPAHGVQSRAVGLKVAEEKQELAEVGVLQQLGVFEFQTNC